MADKWSKTKDPDAVLDYELNWATYLGDDTITDATFTQSDDAEGAVAVDDSSFTDTSATVWLSAGTVGTKYTVTCHITTAGGRQDDRSLYLTIKEL